MFKKMRRKDRAMGRAAAKIFLENATFGILSTVSESNTPYGTPMSFAYTNEVIYLHSALEGKKLDNIANCDKVCFTVIDEVETLPAQFATKYKSVILFGKIVVVEDETEKRQGLIAMIQKYSPDFYESGLQYIDNAVKKTKVLKIEVENITGKEKL